MAVKKGAKANMTKDMYSAFLRKLRKEKKFSLKDLSTIASVSSSMISKIERGDVQPTLSVAVRLAEALDTTLSEMVRHDDYSRVFKIAAKDQKVLVDKKSGMERKILSPVFDHTSLEILHSKIPSKVNLGTFPGHKKGTHEYVLVLKGELRMTVNGTSYDLKAGDTLYYEAHFEHGMENLAGSQTEYIVVIEH